MRKINPEYVKRLNAIANGSPYFSLISMEIRNIGSGFSALEIELNKKHLQPYGFVHGGVFASIIDAACFWAVYCNIEDTDTGITTVDLKLNFLAPAKSGKLIAKGRQIKLGKTLGYADAEVTDEKGNILAHGSSTLMVLSGKGLKPTPPLPPKFLE